MFKRKVNKCLKGIGLKKKFRNFFMKKNEKVSDFFTVFYIFH